MKVGDLVKPLRFHEEAQKQYGNGLVVRFIGRIRGEDVFAVYFIEQDEEMDFFRGELGLVSESR